MVVILLVNLCVFDSVIMVVATRSNDGAGTSQEGAPIMESQLDFLIRSVTQMGESIKALELKVNGNASGNNGEGSSQRRGSSSGQSGGHGSQNGAQYRRLTKVEFPRFHGEDVQGWLYRVNQFFLMDQVDDDEQRIRLVSMHVFDKALQWHKQFMKRHGEVATWDVYERQVKKRFDSVFDDPMIELKNLRQTGSVQVYQESFELLLNKVELSEKHAISLYLGGLRDEIAMLIRMLNPTCLTDVFCWAKMEEARLGAIKKRSVPLLPTLKWNNGWNTNKNVAYPARQTTNTMALHAN